MNLIQINSENIQQNVQQIDDREVQPREPRDRYLRINDNIFNRDFHDFVERNNMEEENIEEDNQNNFRQNINYNPNNEVFIENQKNSLQNKIVL